RRAREVPQSAREGLRPRPHDQQDRRPEGGVRRARREGQAGRGGGGAEAEDLAGARHRRRSTAATAAVAAPNQNVAAGANTTQRSPATMPEASFTVPTHVWYAPRTVAFASFGARSATSARCVPSAIP